MFNQALYDKILAKVRKDEAGCWLWTGPWHSYRKYAANRYGYIGMRKADGKLRSVCTHRAMYIALHGWLTNDQCVCHRCDVPLCCNPDHLFIGSHKDNMADSKKKGRHFLSAKTHCKRGHPLSGENLYIKPCSGMRGCKTCQRERLKLKYRTDAAYREKRKEERRLKYRALHPTVSGVG